MITEYFSILLRKFKKITITTNLKKKSFLQQISSNQILFFRKNPFYNKSQAIKSYFLEKILFTTNLKQSNQTIKVKKPPFLIATPIK